jgi:hypothetical protein
MLVSRREFLKLILGTVPAVALSGPLATLWPETKKSLPVGEPVELYLDEENCLVSGPFLELDWTPTTRREYFDWDDLPLRERLEYWRESWRADERFHEFLYEGPEVDQWTDADHATFRALEADQADWLDGEMSYDELPERDLALMTEYGAAVELFDQLPEKQARALGLHETVLGGPGGGGGYAIEFRGDVTRLNATLAALGINVVVRRSLYDDGEDWDDDEDWGDDEGESA